MTATIEPTTWPRVEATLYDDGTAEVMIGGALHAIAAGDIEEARSQVVTTVAERAQQLGRPLRALTRDPAGSWPLVIYPDGTVVADNDSTPSTKTGTKDVALTAPTVTTTPRDEAETATEARTEAGEGEPGWTRAAAASTPPLARPVEPVTEEPYPTRRERRQSFLTQEQVEEPATHGWRGALSHVGIRISPSARERAERSDALAVSQHWPGPRTIAIVNGKGGAGKTPTTVLLAAVFARYGGSGVLTWDNNQTRGTLGWRTEQGPHESTLLDLLPAADQLRGTGAQSADLAHYVHHQTRDRFDVLRSKPMALAHEQRIEPKDVDAIHAVAAKYYRLIFIDSGNDESDPMWRRMIDLTDQLVVATTTRNDHAEAGALLLEGLFDRDERSARLASQAVVVVTQANSKAPAGDAARVANGYDGLARQAVTIPFDPAMVDGLLRHGSLRPTTQRAWLAAGAAVASGL